MSRLILGHTYVLNRIGGWYVGVYLGDNTFRSLDSGGSIHAHGRDYRFTQDEIARFDVTHLGKSRRWGGIIDEFGGANGA